MPRAFGQVLGILSALLALIAILANGVYMLFSPRKWLTSRYWLFRKSAYTIKRYDHSEDLSRLQFLGVILMAAPFWIVYQLFAR